MKTFHESLAAGIERAMNAWLDTDPRAASRLGEIENLVIGLEITTFPIQLFFLPTAGRIRVSTSTERPVQTHIRGRLLDLIRLAGDGQRPGKAAQLTISGDVATGHAFQHLLKAGDFDWEELLAQRVGDIPAHELAKGIRATRRWAKRSLGLLEDAVGEYLTEETQLVAGRYRIDSFIREVDELRDRVEALEVRAGKPTRK